MSTTLPQFVKNLDNKFVQTWYDIKKNAIDNVLLATPIWAMLKEHGCFEEQTGSEIITETLRYAVGTPPEFVSKGDTLPMGVTETKTMGIWTFRNLAASITRDLITDSENAGQYKIVDYVAQRLGEARDGLAQQFEVSVLGASTLLETGKGWQSLVDVVPLYANVSGQASTYGGVTRATTYSQIGATNGVFRPTAGSVNDWWGSAYKQWVSPIEVNLVTDMKIMFNSLTNNQESPNMIVSDQSTYELYEEFGVDKTQIVRSDSRMLLDLGFQNQEFKGMPWVWSPNMGAQEMLMLNLDYIKVKYRKNLWFDMTEWKSIPNQMERLAHILCAGNIISNQLRRHGRLTAATVS